MKLFTITISLCLIATAYGASRPDPQTRPFFAAPAKSSFTLEKKVGTAGRPYPPWHSYAHWSCH